MMQRTYYSSLRVRIAEEKQLLSEEKWIIDALTKVRKERNRLQIERLELENQKIRLLMKTRTPSRQTPAYPDTPLSPSPSERVMKLMTTTASTSAPIPTLEDFSSEINKDTFCNELELDLTVTNPILSRNNSNPIEEEVESDASDDVDGVLLDMNMFMNGDPYGKRK